ncbi:hypothetical protein C8Q77DRAFT_19525 [Trametes polyzona]|nr:hypothetical protein C8Q77DRAFT_19525 [Trametes polyzona]
MASSASSFTFAPSAGSPVEAGIAGWTGSSLASALCDHSSSQAPVPPEWHIPSDPLPDASPSPSPLSSTHSLSDAAYASAGVSPSPSPGPSSANSRSKSKSKAPSRRDAKGPNYIPRPPNAFMLFRSEACPRVKASQVENDHRIISKILGRVWRDMDEASKLPYKQLALEKKREHARLYPNYRFAPQQRTEKPKKRNVKRNGPADMQRVDVVASLMLEGKGGDALKAEVEKFDISAGLQGGDQETIGDGYSTCVFDSRAMSVGAPSESDVSSVSSSSVTSSPASLYVDVPAFRSPLLPPATKTPVLRSPLEIPEITAFENMSPVSPMQVSPTDAQVPAPATAPVPLPHVAGHDFHLASGYPAVFQPSSIGLGLDVQFQPMILQPTEHRNQQHMAQQQSFSHQHQQLPPPADSYGSISPLTSVPNTYTFGGYVQYDSSSLESSWAAGQLSSEHQHNLDSGAFYDPQAQAQGFVGAPENGCGATTQAAQAGLRHWQWAPSPAEPQSQPAWMGF